MPELNRRSARNSNRGSGVEKISEKANAEKAEKKTSVKKAKKNPTVRRTLSKADIDRKRRKKRYNMGILGTWIPIILNLVVGVGVFILLYYRYERYEYSLTNCIVMSSLYVIPSAIYSIKFSSQYKWFCNKNVDGKYWREKQGVVKNFVHYLISCSVYLLLLVVAGFIFDRNSNPVRFFYPYPDSIFIIVAV